MKFTSKVLLATTSVVALTGAAQAQQVLINQTVTGTNALTSGNTSKLINTSGFGSVTLQAFQDATNAVNTGSAVYGTSVPPGSVTQTIATGGSLSLTTNNTNAGFSANGAQLVLGSQGIASNVNAAGLTLGNGAIVTVQQNNVGAITANQNNQLSAGYNQPSGSTFGIGQGPAAIQGQSIGAGGVINNTGFQNNGFNLNTASIGVAGASATVGVAQKPGAITSTQTNFADAGQASPTFIDPSITALNQTVTANVNQIDSIGAASGSTLILDGTGSNVGKQSIGTALDSFTVQNTARALTWGLTSGSTGSGSYGSTSGGTGDVSIRSSAQSVGLDFNGVTAGTTATPQNVNFGGTSAGLFEQTATYGSTTTTGSGITIANQPVGGFANFGVTQGSPSDAPVNVSFAGTANGAADVTNVGQIATASLNSATVTGAVNGNLTQTASINTQTVSAGAAVGAGPQLSNFAGAVVQAQGPSTLSNVDQTSALSSNRLDAASVGVDGLTLNQTGYQSQTTNYNGNPSSGVNPGLSSNVLVAGTFTAGTTLGSNATISGSAQTLVNEQNTFSAATSASAGSGSAPAQLNVAQGLTAASLNTGYGGDNFASANAGSGNGVASLSSGSQLGGVNLNSVEIGSTGANTQTAVTQTGAGGGATLFAAGNNTASATGRTASITGYGQSYDVALNSVSLGGSGAKNVTQTSGSATISTENTLTATEGAGSPFASATIGGMMGASQSLTASANAANIGGVGSLVQTAGPINSTLNNSATATTATSAASSITGLVQTTSQSINTGL
jgi:hypothetical protein